MASAGRTDGAGIGRDDLRKEADVAQAFKEVAKGEKAAATMEHQLTNLERKLDDLLASAEGQDDSAAHMLNGKQTVVGEEVPS